jgi:hypothetical protein
MSHQGTPRFGVHATKGREIASQILPAMPVRIRLLSAERVSYTLETWGAPPTADAPAAIKAAEPHGGASLQFWRTHDSNSQLGAEEGTPVFRASYSRKDDHRPRRSFDESWDAYTLRAAFEHLTSPKDALAFLNTLGCPFRTLRDEPSDLWLLTWSELKEWQRMVRALRRTDPLAGWLGGFPHLGKRGVSRDEDFLLYHKVYEEDVSELISGASDETYQLMQGIPPQIVIRRDMYLSRADIEEICSTVEKSFPTPESRIPDSRGWHFTQSLFKHRKMDKARGTPELKQKLIAEIFATTPLDAILATIYVDKLRGCDLQVCALKDCDNTFESSDSRKMYCSQAHAHLASVRHKREEARKTQKPTKKLRKAS